MQAAADSGAKTPQLAQIPSFVLTKRNYLPRYLGRYCRLEVGTSDNVSFAATVLPRIKALPRLARYGWCVCVCVCVRVSALKINNQRSSLHGQLLNNAGWQRMIPRSRDR